MEAQVKGNSKYTLFRVINIEGLNYIWPLMTEFYEEIQPKRYSLLELQYRLLQEVSNDSLGMFAIMDIEEEKPISFATCYLSLMVTPVLFIAQIYTKPDYRLKSGPLKLLYKHIEAWAKIHGCHYAMLNTYDAALVEMYKGMGFVPEAIQMFKEID